MAGRKNRSATNVKIIGASLIVCGTAVMLAASPAAAITRSVDFDNYPAGVVVPERVVENEYALWDVVFPDILRVFTDPRTGKTGRSAWSPNYAKEVEYYNDIVATFRVPQETVSLSGGFDCVGRGAVLIPYDDAGTPLDALADPPITVGYRPAPVRGDTHFTVHDPQGRIASVRFQFDLFRSADQCSGFIDDLAFDSAMEAPPIPDGPVVRLLPQTETDFVVNPLVVSGTYSGTDLDEEMRITITPVEPTPGIWPYTQWIPLANRTGTNIPFTVTARGPGLPVGHFVVTVSVTDGYDRQGSDLYTIANSPPIFGGAGLGNFRFAASADDGACQLLFFDGGVLDYRHDGKPAKQVNSQVAAKWLATRHEMLLGDHTLGCPIPSRWFNWLPGWIVQDFKRGRIYVSSDGRAFYVPKLFTDAMRVLAQYTDDALQELIQIGVPVEDPSTYNLITNPTWMFQRFDANGLGPAYYNTIEVRGRGEAKLYVERIGGDRGELKAAMQFDLDPQHRPILDEHTPTIWQTSMPCYMAVSGSPGWPEECRLEDFPEPLHGMGFPGAPRCDGKSGAEAFVAGLHYADASADSQRVFYRGIVKRFDEVDPRKPGSHLAYQDDPTAHDYCNETVSDRVGEAFGIGCAVTVLNSILTGGLGVVLCAGAAHASIDDAMKNHEDIIDYYPGGYYCHSDWNLHTRPLPQYWDVASRGNVRHNEEDFELEFEARYARDFFKHFYPWPGDLIYAYGRQIVDCGHADFNAEIHPPKSLAVIRSTVTYGKRYTNAYVWSNGYMGDSESELVHPIWAPPRTSARAELVVYRSEEDYSVARGIDEEVQKVDSGVDVRITPIVGFATSKHDSGGKWHYDPESTSFREQRDYLEISWKDPD